MTENLEDKIFSKEPTYVGRITSISTDYSLPKGMEESRFLCYGHVDHKTTDKHGTLELNSNTQGRYKIALEGANGEIVVIPYKGRAPKIGEIIKY